MEIERKFLIKTLPENLTDCLKKKMLQGYISTAPVIRLRSEDEDCKLTVKGSGQLSREEFELDITTEQFSKLWKKLEDGTPISKTRYYFPLDGLTSEIDVYGDRLEGLYTVEVEFESVSQAEAFSPPDWFGKEVTFDNNYGNSSLFVNGQPKG